ncbi:MAG: hypothetical protein JXD23_14985 [Spirochaetales bacterium]|nr:hypothetical protein [Spirochaetales bacterium]
MAKRFCLALAVMCVALAPAAAQAKGVISYTIDGKPFKFTDGKMEYHVKSGYVSLTYEKVDVFTMSNGRARKGGAVGVTIQVGGDEPNYPGLHEANSSDEIPVFFSWYEVVKDPKTGKVKDVRQHTLSLDSGDTSKMFVKIKIDSFGPAGSMITGTFTAKAYDDEGVLHSVTDGVFRVPRVDTAD